MCAGPWVHGLNQIHPMWNMTATVHRGINLAGVVPSARTGTLRYQTPKQELASFRMWVTLRYEHRVCVPLPGSHLTFPQWCLMTGVHLSFIMYSLSLTPESKKRTPVSFYNVVFMRLTCKYILSISRALFIRTNGYLIHMTTISSRQTKNKFPLKE